MTGNREKRMASDAREEIAIDAIRRALSGLRFGTVTAIVQDGIVVQVDRTERERIDYSRIEKVSDGEGI